MSLELLLVLTILVVGALVGVIALRNGLFRLASSRAAATVFVKDSTAPSPFQFRPVSYDLCEAPQVLCLDPANQLSALLGMRPNRFVSRDRVYYTGPGCTGTPYVAVPGDSTLPVGYFNALQGVTYAVGAPLAWGTPGCLTEADLGLTPTCEVRLFRSSGAPTPVLALSRFVSLNPDCALGVPPILPAPLADVCETIAPAALTLLPAVEVTTDGMVGSPNLLTQYTPLFTVMPKGDATVTFTPAVPEDAPLQDASAPGSTTAPGDPATFPSATPEPPGPPVPPPPPF